MWISAVAITIILCRLAFAQSPADMEADEFAQMPKCPNGQSPRRHIDGLHALQCTPGELSSEICGDGHACWFNGFNYLCCPITQPDAIGTVHRFKPSTPTKKSLISKMTITKSTTPSLCPFPSVAMRNANFEIIECDQHDHKCPSATAFCSTLHQRYICCQQNGDNVEPTAVRVSADSFPMSFQPLPLARAMPSTNDQHLIAASFASSTTDDVVTTTDDVVTTTDIESTTVPATTTDQPPLELSALKEVPTTIEPVSIHPLEEVPTTTEPPPSIRASPQNGDDIYRYRPHSSGGYVLEKHQLLPHPINQQDIRRSPVAVAAPSAVVDDDRRVIVQEYLLEQIRNGWPYHERYYHIDTRDNDVPQLPPLAVVHFPKMKRSTRYKR